MARFFFDFDFQVKEKLGLSYDNIRSLHQIIDNSIPSRATWKHKYFSFEDSPEEKHLVQFRDPLQAIQSLLSNPAHAKSMVFSPTKVYTSKKKESRIYNEMWTGRWWSAVQASEMLLAIALTNENDRVSYLPEALLLQL